MYVVAAGWTLAPRRPDRTGPPDDVAGVVSAAPAAPFAPLTAAAAAAAAAERRAAADTFAADARAIAARAPEFSISATTDAIAAGPRPAEPAPEPDSFIARAARVVYTDVTGLRSKIVEDLLLDAAPLLAAAVAGAGDICPAVAAAAAAAEATVAAAAVADDDVAEMGVVMLDTVLAAAATTEIAEAEAAQLLAPFAWALVLMTVGPVPGTTMPAAAAAAAAAFMADAAELLAMIMLPAGTVTC